MIFLLAALIGVLIGVLLGGRLANLPSLKMKGLWLVVVGLVVQLAIFPLFSDRPLVPYATVPLHVLSYGLVFAFLVLNLRRRPLLLVGVGALLNLAAIAGNGGRMPASITALERAGVVSAVEHLTSEGVYGNILLMGEGTRLDVLGDWLYLPDWIPAATAFSIGDLLIVLGLTWLIVQGMKGNA
jgi:hypothetical protein